MTHKFCVPMTWMRTRILERRSGLPKDTQLRTQAQVYLTPNTVFFAITYVLQNSLIGNRAACILNNYYHCSSFHFFMVMKPWTRRQVKKWSKKNLASFGGKLLKHPPGSRIAGSWESILSLLFLSFWKGKGKRQGLGRILKLKPVSSLQMTDLMLQTSIKNGNKCFVKPLSCVLHSQWSSWTGLSHLFIGKKKIFWWEPFSSLTILF